MPQLFSRIKIGRVHLPNRIALAPIASGYAMPDGFVHPQLSDYYLRRAEGGVGLLISEPLLVTPPDPQLSVAHLGLYHDAFVPALAVMVRAIHDNGGRVIVSLCDPIVSHGDARSLAELREAFIRAAWRAWAAGADGVQLSSADDGSLATLISPLHNHRLDRYGGDLDGRLRLALEIIEGVREWLGRRLLISFRLNADELTAGGIGLQDARVIARRLATAGVSMLDITVMEGDNSSVAQFPGWRVPIAAAIKRFLPDVPIITGGGLDDALLADISIRDGSIDLVMLGRGLRANPDWPRQAYAILVPHDNDGDTHLRSFVLDDEDRYA